MLQPARIVGSAQLHLVRARRSVRAAGAEERRALLASPDTGEHEGRVSRIVDVVGVDAALQKQLHDVVLPSSARLLQRADAHIAPVVDLSVVIEQQCGTGRAVGYG